MVVLEFMFGICVAPHHHPSQTKFERTARGSVPIANERPSVPAAAAKVRTAAVQVGYLIVLLGAQCRVRVVTGLRAAAV